MPNKFCALPNYEHYYPKPLYRKQRKLDIPGFYKDIKIPLIFYNISDDNINSLHFPLLESGATPSKGDAR